MTFQEVSLLILRISNTLAAGVAFAFPLAFGQIRLPSPTAAFGRRKVPPTTRPSLSKSVARCLATHSAPFPPVLLVLVPNLTQDCVFVVFRYLWVPAVPGAHAAGGFRVATVYVIKICTLRRTRKWQIRSTNVEN